MHVFDLIDDSGTLLGFEVSNLLLSRRAACKIVRAIDGVVVTHVSRLFRDTDDFCEFELGSEVFVIMEPFGDNSRYWIGPKTPGPSESLAVVRAGFEKYQLWRSPFQLLLIVAISILLIARIVGLIFQDKCLDSGGQWEHQSSTCKRIEN